MDTLTVYVLCLCLALLMGAVLFTGYSVFLVVEKTCVTLLSITIGSLARVPVAASQELPARCVRRFEAQPGGVDSRLPMARHNLASSCYPTGFRSHLKLDGRGLFAQAIGRGRRFRWIG
jgi:hypothetical protein